jgi:hypothetical protein
MNNVELKQTDEMMCRRTYCMNPKFLFRTGSSLHPEVFSDDSDIDYILIVDHILVDEFNDMDGLTSNKLNFSCKELFNFYWRAEFQPVNGHPISLIIYTWDKFFTHLFNRSAPKMHILRDYKMIVGDENKWLLLRKLYAPDLRSVESDVVYLKKGKWHNAKFLWSWRSVIFIDTGTWLHDRSSIKAAVELAHPGMLEKDIFQQRDFIIQKLEEALEKDEIRY